MLELSRIMARARFALFRDRSGATAIEYGLLAAGVSVVIIATVFLIGDELKATFETVKTCLETGTCS